jgi:hypothetical protein
MVDFRYHIVSIVAIFLALAVGIVLGAGPLKTTSDAQLKKQVGDLRTSTRTLQGSLSQAQAEVQFLDRFGAQAAPGLLSNRLAGLKVAVVSLPGADSALAADVVASLKQANATVTVQATITSSWTDPGHQAALAAALATAESTASPMPSGAIVSTPQVTRSGSPIPSPATSSQLQSASATVYSDVATELAAGLLTSAATPPAAVPAATVSPAGAAGSTAPSAGIRRPTVGTTTRPGAAVSIPPTTTLSSSAVADRTVTALEYGGFLTLSAAVPRAHPTLAVIIAADPPATATDTSRAANAELATLANALRAGSDGTVLAGSAASAGDGGLLALVRASRPTAGELSTVDSVDTVVGRIAVPLALVQQQSDGQVGQYGSVGSTNGPLPPVNGIGPG